MRLIILMLLIYNLNYTNSFQEIRNEQLIVGKYTLDPSLKVNDKKATIKIYSDHTGLYTYREGSRYYGFRNHYIKGMWEIKDKKIKFVWEIPWYVDESKVEYYSESNIDGIIITIYNQNYQPIKNLKVKINQYGISKYTDEGGNAIFSKEDNLIIEAKSLLFVDHIYTDNGNGWVSQEYLTEHNVNHYIYIKDENAYETIKYEEEDYLVKENSLIKADENQFSIAEAINNQPTKIIFNKLIK